MEHQYLMLKKFKIQKENFKSLPTGEIRSQLRFAAKPAPSCSWLENVFWCDPTGERR